MTSSLQNEPVTASFQPPPTQNSAPIIEHRCLYTQDLRRKAKRWQDGFLRFHTFNKRVMVYDIPRNFIGDTHWREDFPIQDGDEFQLDRPVLVQVGEQTGSVDQDLTELLDKRPRKKARLDQAPGLNSSSPPGPSSSNGPKPSNVMARQLVPKSLNALLGTPKGKLGRATLPTKSPFESRMLDGSTGRDAQSLAKRQRIGADTCTPQSVVKNRTLTAKLADEGMLRSGRGQDSIYNRTTGTTVSTETENFRLPRVLTNNPEGRFHTTATLTLPEMEATRPQTGSTSHSCHKSTLDTNTVTTQVDAAVHREVHRSKISGESDKSRSIEPIASEKSISARNCEPSNIINILSDTETSSTHSDETPTARIRLQMASRKPRRKLMYKDLLPPSAPITDKKLSKSRDSIVEEERPVNCTSPPPFKKASQTKETRDDFKRARRKRKDALPTLAKDQFCDDENSTPRFDQANTPPIQPNSHSRPPTTNTNRRKSPHNVPDNMTIPRPASTIHDTNAVLAQMDEILLSQSQDPNSRTSKQRTPLQKSNSDMPRSTMARSVSDIGKPDSSSGPISEAKEQIISPWSREAWDLFGCGRDGEAVDFGGFCRKEGV